jgi:hypothetical protein
MQLTATAELSIVEEPALENRSEVDLIIEALEVFKQLKMNLGVRKAIQSVAERLQQAQARALEKSAEPEGCYQQVDVCRTVGCDNMTEPDSDFCDECIPTGHIIQLTPAMRVPAGLLAKALGCEAL